MSIYEAAEKYLIAANEYERAHRDAHFMSNCMKSAEAELLKELSKAGIRDTVTINIGKPDGVQVHHLGHPTAHAKKVDLLNVSKPVNPEPHYDALELDLS